MYDAAAVGARCSGAAAAMLLPRKGYRAVMLDRNAADNDTLHPTHFVQPKAANKLKKWGLRAALAAACPSSITIPSISAWHLFAASHPQWTATRAHALHRPITRACL